MKKHDETEDLRILNRKVNINYGTKTLSASTKTILGIRSWGRIDFLVNHCGYHFIWNNDGGFTNTVVNEENKSYREIKKSIKEHKLSDKTKRTSNKEK